MKENHYKIATRKSPLALQQALLVKERLLSHYPEMCIELLPLETSGDNLLQNRLADWGGKGLFVKELEQALLEKRADFAVHSMKDVPTIQPEGLELAVICEREDPRDVFISVRYEQLSDLPEKAKVGTASLRRQCQLRGLHGDLDIQMLRGNVNTRLKRLMNGEFEAIVLAAAGLKRLNLEHHIKHYFSVHQILPAAGQGALGIECRADDHRLKEKLQVLDDPITKICLEAERALTHRLGGNCRSPVAAFCEKSDTNLSLRGLVGSPDGDILLYCCEKGDISDPKTLGVLAAETLLRQGAGELLT